MTPSWSVEISFTTDAIRKHVPNEPGVYQFLQSEEYPCYKGKTRVVRIGESSSLRDEVLNHQHRHTVANRLARIRKQPSIRITVTYTPVHGGDTKAVEDELLRKFEDEHWDLPVLNSSRGYKRDEDKHYRD